MKKRLVINVGFITNSSSCIHHFPSQVLLDPEVQHFLQTYGVQDGFVGANLWHRGMCGTLAITTGQHKEVLDQLLEPGYRGMPTKFDSGVIVIYGDEYDGLANIVANLMQKVCERLKLEDSKWEYN